MERIAQLAGSSSIAQMGLESTDVKSCCAALYQLEPVRLLLGDTLHPGGLALTHRLGKLVGIQRDDLVLDVACGRGASSMAVARSFHCHVVGVDLGREGIAEASRLAKEQRIEGIASFVHGDVERLPLSPDSFDAALCECSMSLFPDKARGVAEVASLLRAGWQVRRERRHGGARVPARRADRRPSPDAVPGRRAACKWLRGPVKLRRGSPWSTSRTPPSRC